MPRARPILTEQLRARLAALSDPGPASLPETETGPTRPDRAPDDSPETAPTDSPPRQPTVRNFTRTHLVVVAVVITVAVAFAGWTILRARDHAIGAEVPITITSPSAATTSTPPAEPDPSPPQPAQIAVHVVGEVAEPGVVELTDGARVADAIAATGGLTASAIPGRLNLAQRLHDGEQVFISDALDPPSEVLSPAAGPPQSSPESAPPGSQSQVNLNTATAEQLETLPGVGPATAQAILAWRSTHGEFTTVEELQEVDGIGPKTFARLKPLVTV